MRKLKEKLREFYWQHYSQFDDMAYSAKVYAIFMVTFVLPMVALYVALVWFITMIS
jgi:hypothetical protein